MCYPIVYNPCRLLMCMIDRKKRDQPDNIGECVSQRQGSMTTSTRLVRKSDKHSDPIPFKILCA